MQAEHSPLQLDTDDGLQPALNQRVNPRTDQAQADHSWLTHLLRSLRQRIRQYSHREAPSPAYTLLLPDGHVLVLCCVKLSQLLSACVHDEQDKEPVCAL